MKQLKLKLVNTTDFTTHFYEWQERQNEKKRETVREATRKEE